MVTYIALLRGINVGRNKSVKMTHLKRIFELLKFQNVRTYIQSGNVVFEADQQNQQALAQRIETELKQVFNFEIHVIVREVSQLEEISQSVPFVADAQKEERNYVTFLAEEPAEDAIKLLNASKNDKDDDVKVINKEVYILCKKGYQGTKFSNTYLEKNLSVKATTRNIDTVNKIIELAKS